MVNGVCFVASWVTARHEYSQQDTHHRKGMGTDSYSPCPGLAGENGVGAHRQEESTQPFDNGGRNNPRLRDSQRKLYASVQQGRQKKGNGFYNNQNADHRDYAAPAMGSAFDHRNFSSLHNNGQIHASMDGTIEFEGASARKGASRG